MKGEGMFKESFVEAIKGAPPVAAAAYTREELIAIATAVYLLLQIAYLVRKWWREERAWTMRLRRFHERVRDFVTGPAPLN